MFSPNPQHDRIIGYWLLLICAMIFAMVVLGGVTRLTGSGLSMVEWDPIFGILPPLSQAEWERVFELYRASPEYLHINRGMDLAGFKGIYAYEYAHRVLGRLIGSAFLLPFLYFLWRGWVRRPLILRLSALFVLGGVQGVLGWYMVMSGLVDRPQVSQYRLSAHLMLAILIYLYSLWLALGLLRGPSDAPAQRGLHRGSWLVFALLLLTVTSGGFVAGLDAGLAFNTFPLMTGHWIPPGLMYLEPAWRNLFENIATVQFNHRVLALSSLVAMLLLWLAAWRRRDLLPAAALRGHHLWALMILVQVALGISTLLSFVAVPLASAHQAGALLLLSLGLYSLHAQRPTRPAG